VGHEINPDTVQTRGFKIKTDDEVLTVNVMPVDLTEWVPGPILKKLAIDAVQTLYWSDESAIGLAADLESDRFQTTLASVVYCCAVSGGSCEEIAERMSLDHLLEQPLGVIENKAMRLRFIVGQHTEVLKRCLTGVFEAVWTFRQWEWITAVTPETSSLGEEDRTKFFASFRKSLLYEASERIQRALERS